MRTKIWPLVLLAALLVAAALTACGALGGPGGEGDAPGTDRPLVEGERPEASGSARRGGVVRLTGGLPPTLDPAVAQDATSAEYIVHLFSGLVRLSAELEVEPDLAERWEVADDGRTYTFRLREEATYADGRPVLAEDVVYSLERAAGPELRSPVAASYLGDIVGVAEYAAGRAEGIAGLRVVSDRVLEITTDAPKAYFLAKLTYPAAFVVDREQIAREGPEWVLRPNGSGPFVLDGISGRRIVLTRNERYYGRLPDVDRVEYVIEGGFPVTMYENDELDLVEVPPSEVERVRDPENPLHAQLQVASELSITYLGLNVDAPPFDDVAVRQAFARAIDRGKLADLVLQGTATAAQGILPPGMPDHDGSLSVHPYDPDGARELLAGSRYGGDGAMPELVLAVSGTSGNLDSLTEAILSMLEDNLDLEITVHQVEWADYLHDMNVRRYQMYLTGWIADYPDSENFLDLLFHGNSPQNHTGYASPEVNRLLEAARVETDEVRRSDLYRQAERHIVEEAPWVPLVHGLQISLVKPYVRGVAATSAIYPWLQDVSIDEGG